MLKTKGEKQVASELMNGVADLSGIDLDPPAWIATEIAAQQRQIRRNTAWLAKFSLGLARQRDSKDEVKVYSKQFDDAVKDIAELDRQYPGAKARMKELDLLAEKAANAT